MESAVGRGEFRGDLFYRLNVIRIDVPPLRERREDIPRLAQFFLARYASEFGKSLTDIDANVLDALIAYDYPGNVRELENIVERAVALEQSDQVTIDSIPTEVASQGLHAPKFVSPEHVTLPNAGFDLDGVVGTLERRLITQALEQSDGNKTEAARLLGISFRSLRYRLEKLDLS